MARSPLERHRPDYRVLFEAVPNPYLVLLADDDFTIVAANDAFLQATMTTRERLLGRGLFEVFPEGGNEGRATRALRASLRRAVESGRSESLPMQRYDPERPGHLGGGHEERYWSTRNVPLSNESGEVTHVILQVEDVTDFARLDAHVGDAEEDDETRSLRERAQKMEAEVYQRSREVAEANSKLRVANQELAEARASVDAERRRLREVFEQVPAIVGLITLPDRVHVLANARFEEAAGRPIVGKTVDEAFPELEGQGFFELFDRACETGQPQGASEMPAVLQRGGESVEALFDLVLQPMHSPEGELEAVIVFAVEVTEKVRARERAERIAKENEYLYREAQAASEAKSDFLAIMSHELRTPLNAIIGYADLLRMGVPNPLPDSAQKQVQRIRSSGQHLLQIIDEVLTFSRMETGSLDVRGESVELGDLAAELAELIEPLANEKGLEFRLRLPADSVVLETDPGKVRQILLNLLFNAVKFTDRGEVVLELRPSPAGAEFEVRDTGIGIPESELEAIFDPFRQVEETITRTAGGTGLGLSIARQLSRLLGGDIDVDSTEGEGSVFTVTLPPVAGDGTG